MTIYICKCGRRVRKSSNADNTGNRIENYRPGFECYGCPYVMPLGGDKWDEETKNFVRDVKGYECRMSKTLSYASQFIGSTKDKCTCSVASLDFDFLEQISTWVKQTFTLGELTGHFSRDKIRATDYCYDGRYKYTLFCASNKSGVAAKAALFSQFFNPDGSRRDMAPQQEMEKVLADIKKATHPELPQPYHVGDIYANADGSIRMRIIKVGIGFVIQEGTADEWEPAGKGALYPHLTHAIEVLAVLVCNKGLKPAEKEDLTCATVPNAGAAVTTAERAAPNTAAETLTTSESAAGASASCREKSPSCSSSAQIAPAESFSAGEAVDGTSSPNLTAPADMKTPTVFDYTGLDTQTVDVLHMAESQYSQGKKMTETGLRWMVNAVSIAHDALCSGVVQQLDNSKHGNRGNDSFRAWCESISLSKSSAYNLLRVAERFGNIEVDGKSILDVQPATLLYEAAKPNAPADMIQKVTTCEITSSAEYRAVLKENQQLRTDRVNAINQAEREKARADTAESQLDAVRADVVGLTQRVDAAEAREEEAWQMQSKAEQRAKNAEEALKKQPITTIVDKDEVKRQAAELSRKAVQEAQAQADAAKQALEKYQQAAEGFLAPEQACAQQAQIIADSMRSMYLGWFGPASSTGVPLARMAAPIYQVCDEIRESLEDDTTIHPTAAGSEEDAEREALFV